MELSCSFQSLTANDLYDVCGGANGTLIVTGICGMIAGAVIFFCPGGKAVGGCTFVAGAVTVIAGIVY